MQITVKKTSLIKKYNQPAQSMQMLSVSGKGLDTASVVVTCPSLLTITSVTLLHTTAKYRPGIYSLAGTLKEAPDKLAFELHKSTTVVVTIGHPGSFRFRKYIVHKVHRPIIQYSHK